MLFDDVAIRTNRPTVWRCTKNTRLSRPLSYYSEFEDRIVIAEDSDGDGRADTSRVYSPAVSTIRSTVPASV